MKGSWRWWLLIIIISSLVGLASGGIDWKGLKDDLKGPQGHSAAKLIVKNWSKRPIDFFEGIDETCWRRIIPILSPSKISAIKVTEFELSKAACKEFAKFLPDISNANLLPINFRSAVYHKASCEIGNCKRSGNHEPYLEMWLDNTGLKAVESLGLDEGDSFEKAGLDVEMFGTNNDDGTKDGGTKDDSTKDDGADNHGSNNNGINNLDNNNSDTSNHNSHDNLDNGGNNIQEIAGMINYIPRGWVEKDSFVIMKALLSSPSTPKLGLVNNVTLEALFSNRQNACSLITLDALKSLNPKQLQMMTPECMGSIKGLGVMDLSTLMEHLPYNAFSLYNGPLSRVTIKWLQGSHLQAYASLIEEGTLICTVLEIHYLSRSAIKSLTARCLYGYFSQKRTIGMGDLWNSISKSTLLQFTPEMQNFWQNIHPTDFSSMLPSIREIILPNIQATRHFTDFSIISSSNFKGLSVEDLYKILSNKGGPIGLGRNWELIPPHLISKFTDEMMKSINNISLNDFKYIPGPILQVILGSDVALDNLPQPIEHIILSPFDVKLVITRQRFLAIAKRAPNIAGQLLLSLSNNLPVDIFADCNGNILRNLIVYNGPNNKELFWNDLFAEIERREKLSSHIISLASTRAQPHLCSTIKDFKEYLSLPWLRRNPSEACRLALRFDLEKVDLLIKAPELISYDHNVPWKEMKRQYTSQNWIMAFTIEPLARSLGEICEFWSSIIISKSRSVIETIGSNAFKFIRPHCVKRLYNPLKKNPLIISHLDDDAFALYHSGELPCALSRLSPLQILNLSKFNIATKNFLPGEKGNSDPSTDFGISLAQVTSLNCDQLKALFSSQWIHVSEEIKSFILDQLIDSVMVGLKGGILGGNLDKKVKGEGGGGGGTTNHHPSPSKLQCTVDGGTLMELDNIFNIYSTIRGARGSVKSHVRLDELLTFIRNSHFHHRFVNLFRESPLLGPLGVALARNADELRFYLNDHDWVAEATNDEMIIEPNWELEYSSNSGFDRSALLSLIRSSPEILNSSGSLINSDDEPIDSGQSIQILTCQVLAEIKRKVIVPVGPRSQLCLKKFQDSSPGVGPRDNLVSSVNNRMALGDFGKFVWGVSREVGFISGMFFGIALRQDIRLSFVLDPDFYSLIIDTSDSSIEKYYKKSYAQELFRLGEGVSKAKGKDTGGLDEELQEMLCEPLKVKYIDLGWERDPDNDNNTTNSNDGDYHQVMGVKVLGKSGGQRLKLDLVGDQVLKEFKAFIRDFFRGMGLVLPPIRTFPTIPTFILQPMVDHLPSLLNAVPVTSAGILTRTTFYGNEMIDSFVDSKSTTAAKVVIAFINSLSKAQLERLLTIWTGIPTPSLEYTLLKVKFKRPSFQRSIKVDLFNGPPKREINSTIIGNIPRGRNCRELFSRIIRELYGYEFLPLDFFCLDQSVEMFPISISNSQKKLSITLQPTLQLINSLIHMINTNPALPMTATKG